MEAPTLGWIDIDSVIYDYLGRSEQSDHKYKKCFDIAFGGMDDLGINFFYKIKSVRLPVLGTKVIQLPGDCLQWVKVGYFDWNGNIVPFAYNGNKSSFAGLLPNRLERVHSLNLYADYDGWSNVFYNYNGGEGVSNVYGVSGAPYTGSFIVAHNYIELDPSTLITDVCLEYVANPGITAEGYYIPVQFRKALLSYISWQDIEHLPPSRRGGLGDKQVRRSNYYNDRRLAIAEYKPFRFDQQYIWNLQNQRMCVKA